MFRVIDPSSLLQPFFRSNQTEIVDKINLLKVFKDYRADIDDLDNSRSRLHNIVSEVISSLMDNFNMVDYLLGDTYPYLAPSDLQEEIDRLIQVGQPSYRNKERNATSPVRMLIANVDPSRSAIWRNAISPYFPLHPVILQSSDPNELILLSLHPCAVS